MTEGSTAQPRSAGEKRPACSRRPRWQPPWQPCTVLPETHWATDQHHPRGGAARRPPGHRPPRALAGAAQATDAQVPPWSSLCPEHTWLRPAVGLRGARGTGAGEEGDGPGPTW